MVRSACCLRHRNRGRHSLHLILPCQSQVGSHFTVVQVKQGAVVYVLGEGRGGLKSRIAAWLREHQLEDVDDVFFVLAPVQFHQKEDVDAIRVAIKSLGIDPALVVIDTFSRCSVGVKENDATEMGEWIEAIRELQEQMSVDVLALHHASKPKGEKDPSERGSSAFIAATDTAIRLKRHDKTITVVCEKQKDAEHFDRFSLCMKVVGLGNSEHAEPMTSCVLVSADDPKSSDDLSAHHRTMLAALASYRNHTAQRADWMEKTGLTERTFDRRRNELLQESYIKAGAATGIYTVTEKGLLAIATESPIPSQGEAA